MYYRYRVVYWKDATKSSRNKTFRTKQKALEFGQKRAIEHNETACVYRNKRYKNKSKNHLETIIRYWWNDEFGLQCLKYEE